MPKIRKWKEGGASEDAFTARKRAKGSPYDYTGVDSQDIPEMEQPADPQFLKPDQKLTPSFVALMAEEVRQGVPITTAATALGAGGRWRNWAYRAREHERLGRPAGWGEGESYERMWLAAMDQAKAQNEAAHVKRINAASKGEYDGDWKASAWMLERTASRRWFLQHKMELIANNTQIASISSISTDRLIKMAKGVFDEVGVDQIKLLTNSSSTEASPDLLVEAEAEEVVK